MRSTRLVFIALAFAAVLAGCQSVAHRPILIGRHEVCTPAERSPTTALRENPQLLAGGKAVLHFVEFDDQGWLYPDPPGDAPDAVAAGRPSSQIDCAIDTLSQALQKTPGEKVSLFVYVHGWHHDASDDDADLVKFRRILEDQTSSGRKVVGVYVGWQGESIDVPGVSLLTIWGRKNAAEHVAAGRVRELFSRIRGLRAFWNGRRLDDSEIVCAYKAGTRLEPGSDQCPLRTILIGHSFGGLILFESAQPYLMETLTVYRDIDEHLRPKSESPTAARARGLADMIILLNPAFEGSRWEPIHQANLKYPTDGREPPLLVSLTSSADWATGTAFPAIRVVNTILQYPATSDDESIAMKRTPGHIDRFVTHRLCTDDTDCDPHWGGGRPMKLCDSLYLFSKPIGKMPIVWNVSTVREVIADHNDISNALVLSFIGQMYAKVVGMPDTVCR